jgi:hypothetical protein
MDGFLVGWLVGFLLVTARESVMSIKRIDKKGKITNQTCLRLQ